MNNTPFFSKIKKLSKNKTRFFVPGHKGNKTAIPPFAKILPFDITEINGADDLQNPHDTLLKSQENMAKLYEVGASVYSANGCTSCIEAMLATFLNEGDKVIMARNSHVSAVRGCAVLDLTPVWAFADGNNNFDTRQLSQMIKAENPKAVYITSPNYYGQLANVAQCAKVCEEFDIPLLVDNAHGAHLKFLVEDKHPVALGAAASADSVHKTLPCLTGSAVLQLKDKTLAQKARWAVNFFSSTSPSYLLMCSIDLAVGKLLNGDIDFQSTELMCMKVKNALKNLCIKGEQTDPLKITLVPAQTGHNVAEVVKALRRKNIEPEMIDDYHIVLMASPFNKENDFYALVETLKPFVEGTGEMPTVSGILPEPIISIRKATFAAKETVETQFSAGRIAGGIITPCPPGIPVVMPGEVITDEAVSLLIKSGIYFIDVIQ
ncbi:MAG: DegT/DnrJ/EryC1/StrS family aminotransferase [Oscillospiraceae bacterium]